MLLHSSTIMTLILLLYSGNMSLFSLYYDSFVRIESEKYENKLICLILQLCFTKIVSYYSDFILVKLFNFFIIMTFIRIVVKH